MDEDKLIMIDTQTDLIELLSKYPNHLLQALGMCLKTAIDSVNDGKHSQILPKIPKNLLN